MLERIANVRKSIKATMEQKRFRQTAELASTEQRFWQDLNTLRLGADGDDSAFKVCRVETLSAPLSDRLVTGKFNCILT